MKERPIIFIAPMVRAILDGRKTQTRRIVKNIGVAPGIGPILKGSDDAKEWPQFCPYGKPGDRLWVRETSIITPKHWNDGFMCEHTDKEGYPRMVQYIAKHPNTEGADDYKLKKTPSIHMPRWASRILLEVTNVRVERLNDISEEDAIAECVDGEKEAAEIGCTFYEKPKRAYRRLWESINGKGSWYLNPFVWVIEFKEIK